MTPSFTLAEELRPGEHVFLGPGSWLIIPQGPRITHPECNHVSFPRDHSKPNPPCLCVYPTLRVPFGYKYRVVTPDHVDIIGPAVLQREGYTFTLPHS